MSEHTPEDFSLNFIQFFKESEMIIILKELLHANLVENFLERVRLE